MKYLLPVLMLAAACGSDSEEVVEIDRSGTIYTYALNSWDVPTTAKEGANLALDIDGNGTLDNKLGDLLPLLANFNKEYNVQEEATRALETGEITLTIAVQTTSFSTAEGMGFQVYQATDPSIAPCQDSGGTVCEYDPENPDACTCGKHFGGKASYKIAQDSPQNAVVAGNIIGGKFKSQGGKMLLQFSLGNGTVITANLTRAQVEISSIDENGLMQGKIVGGMLTSDIEKDLMPVIATMLQREVLKWCDPDMDGVSKYDDCEAESAGVKLLDQLDSLPENNPDGTITVEDLKVNSTVEIVLAPDVDLEGDDGVPDAISLGIGFTAVAADFAVPGGALATPAR